MSAELTPIDGLTDQMQRFCLEYLKTGNGTQSAIKAGYSEKSASQIASGLLKNQRVQAFLELQKESLEAIETATLEGLKMYWVNIMRTPEESTPNRLRASELLAKSIGAFDDTNDSRRPIEIIFNVPKSD